MLTGDVEVLKACSHGGLADEALDCFDRMHKVYKVEASAFHYSCLVDTLSRAGALFEIDTSNAANYVLLARIYASAGRYEEAERMRMEPRKARKYDDVTSVLPVASVTAIIASSGSW
ncbi:hypothetical protein V6N13_018892 [Hibiscus sabdariffa]|uniref:Pentatricopeptide repeat-containing protein n=1 Tax=Hibiscus sabdariffa TaxID=183260 RepID=A0ABR2EKK0_9ROSI